MKYLLSLFLVISFQVDAQTWYLKRDISWNIPVDTVKAMTFRDIIAFDKADYENYDALLPRFFENFRWQGGDTDVKVGIFRAEYQAVTPDNEALEKFSILSDSIVVQTHLSSEDGRLFLQIALVPFRKNPQSGRIERLVSFVLDLESLPGPIIQKSQKALKKSSSVVQSKLSSGNWFKIRIQDAGIYKLTYDQLSGLGLSDPETVKIYGWGGQCLPDDATMGEQDDLRATQIYMNKGQDGVFNAGDYILFYGAGLASWRWDMQDSIFLHDLNPYSDYGYYFVTSGNGASAQPGTEPAGAGQVTYTTTTYDARAYHELDEVNVMAQGSEFGSGREWYGEEFETTPQHIFNFTIPGIVTDSPVRFKSNVIGRSRDTCSFIISANNANLDTVFIRPTNLSDYTATYAFTGDPVLDFYPTGNTFQLKYRFVKADNDTEGYLDYISVTARAKLELNGNMLMFRDAMGVNDTAVTKFTVGNMTPAKQVWDVTDIHDIRKVEGTLNGNNLSFTVSTPEIREFVAFDPSASFPSPTLSGERLGPVANQNIHGAGQPEYIIVTHPDFLTYADELATYRHEHNQLSVLVVTTEQVFNEFSSGRPDITSIRNMMRYFYKNAAGDPVKTPKYLLLFGDGSYINKNCDKANGSFVPTYQSVNSLSPTSSYVSDDYFALLDDGESMNYGLLDIGVGRLPITTEDQAQKMVDKIIGYEKPERMGDWRNSICFIGDDEDNNVHFTQANGLANYVESNYPYFNINKIFLDAYKQVAEPVGQRYPDVNRAINEQIARGALIINYTGHGGVSGLAHEHVVEMEDIKSWKNADKLPLFMTATCEFSRFDEPNIVSAGEEVLLNNEGGGIALLTTTRLVYSGPNNVLNEHFYEIVFEKDSMGMNYTLGEVMMYSKNKTGFGINKRNFTLLGDPAMKLTYPFNHIATDSINHLPVSAGTDTLSALKKVSISGHVEDNGGATLGDFNGVIYPVVYDKPSVQTTLANDGGNKKTFTVRNSVLYKGKASVKNGYFSFEFYVPKDISYAVGGGKLSYYAEDSVIDAAGAYYDFDVGGSYENAETDVSGPEVNLYMNNEYFRSGGITDANPNLLVKLYDDHGINTAGNSIGHDITGILDDNSQNVIVLNEYYQADLNSYKSGTVEYPLSKLTDGHHTINVKVWDIYNNSNEASIDFVVVSSGGLVLDNLMNFPNPFTESTSITFEHNNSGADLEITIDIFNMAGRLMKTIKAKEFNSGFRTEPIQWNGFDESGNKSRQGLYIYRIHVVSSDGKEATSSGKLIIVR